MSVSHDRNENIIDFLILHFIVEVVNIALIAILQVAVPAISAGQSAARSTTVARPNTKGMVLTKVPVGPASNAGQV